MSLLVFALVGLPLLGFSFAMLLREYPNLQRWISILFTGLHVACSSTLLIQAKEVSFSMGGWAAPYGIELGIDRFSTILLFSSGLVLLAAFIYARLGKTFEKSPLAFPLMNILLMGLSGAFISRDIFNLYVWFEVSLISSFVLLSLEQDRTRLSGALKYVTLNLLSSLLFLLAVGALYSEVRSLNMNEISLRLSTMMDSHPQRVGLIAAIFVVAFGIKAALFPFCSWLPASYHTPSVVTSAVFGGLLSKLGLYAIFRVCCGVFPPHPYISQVILVLSIVSMLYGGIGTVAHTHIRRILSFHVISQVGYIGLAAALAITEDPLQRKIALAAGCFFMAHNILAKSLLFLVSGLLGQSFGSEDVKKLGGISGLSPILCTLFAVGALSLAGIPPTSGFWAKLSLLQAVLKPGYLLGALAMILAGFFTLFSMGKIWIYAYWGELKHNQELNLNLHFSREVIGSMVLVVGIVMLSLLPGYFLSSSTPLLSVTGVTP